MPRPVRRMRAWLSARLRRRPARAELAVGPAAIETITALARSSPTVETGGILFGPRGARDGHRADAERACRPGPRAVATASSLEWDDSYLIGFLEAMATVGAGAVVGRWHTHPSGSLEASSTDEVWADVFRRALGLAAIVDLVVACRAGAPIGWTAYLCTEGRYERVCLELPRESDDERVPGRARRRGGRRG